MKKILFFALAAVCSLNVAKADEFIDLGPKEDGVGAWKGDFAVGDINGDGHVDVLFIGEENAWIMLGDGAGNLTKQAECPFINGKIGDISLGDIDGDGDLDVIYCSWGNGTTNASRGIALNDGNGNFTIADPEQYPLITSHTFKVWENGVETARDTIVNIDKMTSCGFADFNLDGLMDYYFFANYTVNKDSKTGKEIEGTFTNNKVIYFQNVDGTFTADEDFFNGGKEYRLNEPDVTVVDFDNNGTPDIWIQGGNEGNTCNNDTQVGDNQRFSKLFKNEDGLSFAEFDFGENGLTFEKANGNTAWADVDGDGYMDLLHHGDGFLCSGESNDRPNRVYKNLNGNGLQEKFSVEVARDGYFGNGTTWVDWNGDGVLDFISGGWDNTVSKQVTYLYLGNAKDPFSFARATGSDYVFEGMSEQSYRIADLNGDRRPDLLQCGHGVTGNRRTTGWTKNTSGTQAVVPEAPVLKDVVIEGEGEEMMITFAWDAPASLKGKPGITWNLALKNKATDKWLYNPMADMATGKRLSEGRMGNVYANTSYILYNLPAGEYEWTVQAIDGSYFGGAFATAKTFTITTSGVDVVNNYKAEVFVADNQLKVVGVQDAAQTVNVYSLSGALVNTASFNGTINMNMPQAGVYMVEVLNADGGRFHTKVVVK